MVGVPEHAGNPDESTGRADDAPLAVERWLSELRVEDAARDRVRRRGLQDAAQEEATLVGLLADLAERGRPVLLDVAGGRHHRGRLRLLGHDFCALHTDRGAQVLIALRAIGSVRPQPGEHGATGDRSVVTTIGLTDALARLSKADLDVVVVRRGLPDPVRGRLRSVGRDVLVLRLDAGGEIYVAVDSLDELSLTVSG